MRGLASLTPSWVPAAGGRALWYYGWFAGYDASRCVLLASGMCKADFALHAVFPFLVDRPTFLGISHSVDPRRSSSFLAVACATLVLRRVLFSLVGMDQKDSYAVRAFYW